jgi:hypothetical protein
VDRGHDFLLSGRVFLQNDCCSAILGCPCGRSDSRERPANMFGCSVNFWEIEGFFKKSGVDGWVASEVEIFLKKLWVAIFSNIYGLMHKNS